MAALNERVRLKGCYFLVLALKRRRRQRAERKGADIDFGPEISFRGDRSLKHTILFWKSFVFWDIIDQSQCIVGYIGSV